MRIVEKIILGENTTVYEIDCEHYQTNVLRNLLKESDYTFFFNTDEFSHFFKCTPDKTLTFKKDTWHGGKKDKKRITFMARVIMTGIKKLTVFVIKNSKRGIVNN